MSSGRNGFVGQTLGAYVVREVLEEEAHATTYEASDVSTGRSVAVKVASFGVTEAPTVVRRFQREARVASAISHPNVGKIFDFGIVDDGRPYLVLESLDRTSTLARTIELRKSMPFDEVISIMAQVVSGLTASHKCGVIHRNLRPGAIVLARRPRRSAPAVRIVDFGSCLIDKQYVVDDDLDFTRTLVLSGLPYYLAPEQAQGATDLDARVDVHACGAMMYEAVTGRRPFGGANYNAVLRSILQTTPDPIRAIRAEVPRDFEEVVNRALAKDRLDRYSSALEMLRALEKLAIVYGVDERTAS